MKIYTITTASDWYFYYGTEGPRGLQRICDLIGDAGISRLYLRTHEGGLACYPSKVCSVHVGATALDRYHGYLAYPKSYYSYLRGLDYSACDLVDELPRAAADAGIEPALWYTIMEDDHGGFVKSDFILNHPQYRCVRRDGSVVDGCAEFWFEEPRQYKLKIVDELLEKGATRILLDLVRRNGMPTGDPDGLYQYGFNPEIVEAFRRQTGLDARALTPGSPDWHRWLDFVSGPTTDFLIEVCRRIRARGAAVELMTWPVHLKTWMGIDLERILDTGVVEAVHVQSQTYSYSPAELERQLAAVRPQVGTRPVQIVPSICGYEGLVPAGLDDYFAALDAQQIGATVIHEADVLVRSRVAERFRALKFGTPHYRRQIRSMGIDRVDWSKVPRLSGFLRGFNDQSIEPDQLTEIQVAHTPDELHVRLTCHERDVASLLPVPSWPDNYNVRQLGARTFWSPTESVHLFLSLPGQFNDYFHFVLDPGDRPNQERRLDEQWRGEWSHTVEIRDALWIATFRVPFKTLDFKPRAGERIAFQAVRAQARPVQVTVLNLTGPGMPSPDEFGFVTF